MRKRRLLTRHQKMLRRAARLRGQGAIAALRAAFFPVYDGDEEIYTAQAVQFARDAWRWALKATDAPTPAADAVDPHAPNTGTLTPRDKDSSS